MKQTVRGAIRSGALVLSLLAAGCWVPAETGKRMESDIRALHAQGSAAQKGIDQQRARLEEQMQRADKQIADVGRTLEELNRAARSTDADFGVQLDRLIKEMQELRGSIELSEYRLKKIETQLEGEGSFGQRLELAEKQIAKDTAAPPPVPVKAESSDTPPKGKKELLAYAQKLLKDDKLSDARGVWRDVVKQWPNEAGVTDQAYFQLGETYYNEKKQRSALAEYIKVVEKFASGDYADDAYFKIGMCSLDIGNLEDAKVFFSEIVHNYKKSPLTKQAQGKLDEVQKRLDKEGRDKDGKDESKGKDAKDKKKK